MCLQVLVRKLLEIVKDLLLDYWGQSLHLLHQDALLHLELSEVSSTDHRSVSLLLNLALIDILNRA